jgi:hypothetical protein
LEGGLGGGHGDWTGGGQGIVNGIEQSIKIIFFLLCNRVNFLFEGGLGLFIDFSLLLHFLSFSLLHMVIHHLFKRVKPIAAIAIVSIEVVAVALTT